MTETKPLPALALTAYALLRVQYRQDEYEQDLTKLAAQTRDAMGVAGGDVHVDFNAKVLRVTTPDTPAADTPPPA